MSNNKISRPWRFNKIIETLSSDVVIGNIEKQKYAVIGIVCHIGVKLRCEKCKNLFVFSAKEQQQWYENLKFWVDSVPVECVECRGITRDIVMLNKRISKVLCLKSMKLCDFNEIVDIAEGLLKNGVKFGGRLGNKIRMAAKRSNHSAAQFVLNAVDKDA